MLSKLWIVKLLKVLAALYAIGVCIYLRSQGFLDFYIEHTEGMPVFPRGRIYSDISEVLLFISAGISMLACLGLALWWNYRIKQPSSSQRRR